MIVAAEASLLFVNAGRIAVLAVPVLLGMAIARSGLLTDVRQAIAALNVYVLFVGFPALIAAGVLAVDFDEASSWGFWLAVPCIDLLLVGICWLVARVLPGQQGGSMALICLFGNTAYLGLPFVVSVLGDGAQGPGSLLVSVQVVIAVVAGPLLLVRWSGSGHSQVSLRSLISQPLLWAPVIGGVLRALPDSGERAAAEVLAPLSASTAPIALFLLGLYLYSERELVKVADRGVWAHVVVRNVVGPVVALGAALVLRRWAGLSDQSAAILMIFGGMPAAIATFSLAQGADVAVERVANAIVRTSGVSLLTLPVVATIAEAIFIRS